MHRAGTESADTLSSSQLLVLVVDDITDVGDVSTGVRLARDVERQLRVLVEALEKELEESVDVLSCDWRVVDVVAIIRIGVADIYRLVEEEQIGVVVPRVGVVDNALATVGDGARSQLEEETSRGRASRATVQPELDWVLSRVVAALEHDEPEVLGVGDVEVTAVLLHARVAKSAVGRSGDTKRVVGEAGVDELVVLDTIDPDLGSLGPSVDSLVCIVGDATGLLGCSLDSLLEGGLELVDAVHEVVLERSPCLDHLRLLQTVETGSTQSGRC